jgi:AcrR family transcriptional regulator
MIRRMIVLCGKAINIRTKNMIVAELKKLMRTHTLSSISVNKIVSGCGISRNTFYYHFDDIPAAIRWMLQKELPLSPPSDDEYTVHGYYYRKMYEILDYVSRNREVFLCIKNSLFRQEFRKIYLEDIRNIFTELMGESEIISGSSKHFADDLVHLLLISSLAVIESWIFGEIKKTPEELIEFIRTAVKNLLDGTESLFLR